MTPLVTTRVNAGGRTQPATSVSFGAVAPSSKSNVVVLDAEFSGFQSVGNLGIGVASSNLPGGPNGVLFYDVFDSPEDVVEPTKTFAGVSGDAGEVNVVDIEMKAPFASKYVALMVVAQNTPLDNACVVLKWFFGFSKEE